MKSLVGKVWPTGLITVGLVVLVAWPRLTALNQYLIVDEADRWRWAEDFVWALSRGDLAGTLVGDGYPGIVPVWAESVWILIEALRRSLVQGQWLGEPGLYLLFHQWDRTEFLFQQRLPIVLLNVVLALAIIGVVWRLFGGWAALLSGLLIGLDPFYLSDSRVNRAEAVITGLMTLSMLFLIFYYRQPRWRYVIISGVLGGLSFLTKIQALAIVPAVAAVGLFIHANTLFPLKKSSREAWVRLVWFGLVWLMAAVVTWVVCWPSMWVIPQETLSLVYDYATRKVGAEGVNLFFWGQTYEDADPGLIFYPVVFLLRLTPLALLGLIGILLQFAHRITASRAAQLKTNQQTEEPLAGSGAFVLVIYVLIYALVMSLGSHKQDRYLLPIFPALDILAALGLLYLWSWLKYRFNIPASSKGDRINGRKWAVVLLAALFMVQLVTVLPHHPYYYSYFNPLFGAGWTAMRLIRIGWGEGMDQVGAYLAAKPNSQNLVVSSRFTHNMLGFKGRLISLLPSGRWTQADYIVLYIQQVQRRQEPSPGFITYFQAQPPEKVVTIGGIDYAWIYPIPFTTPADPQVSLMPGQAALLGYSWESGQPGSEAIIGESGQAAPPAQIRLLWENQGLTEDRSLVARLVGPQTQTDWTPCLVDPAFTVQARTLGAYVESLCALSAAQLPAGLYTVEFGLAAQAAGAGPDRIGVETEAAVDRFTFPQGWKAAIVSATGQVMDTPELERLEAIATEAIPATAKHLDRVYNGQLKLAAFQLDPVQPKAGETVRLTLYWQQVDELLEPLDLVVNLADSRNLPLGQDKATLLTEAWLPGELVTTDHAFDIPPDFEGPLAAQLEVTLLSQAQVPLPASTLTGQSLTATVGQFSVAPQRWPKLDELHRSDEFQEVEAKWQGGITLRGYTLTPAQVRPGETLQVKLFWETEQPVAENYVVFVHLVDDAGQLRAQNDDLPRTGVYPTPWWQPGEVIEDSHLLVLPGDLNPGVYQLAVGLYRSTDGTRLALAGHGDSLAVGKIELRQ